MITLDTDYFFFVAHYNDNGRQQAYILNSDFTIDTIEIINPFYSTLGSRVSNDNIRPENLFSSYRKDASDILEKANSREYEIEVYDHSESKYGVTDEITKKKKVKLTFKAHRVNVKMSYFEEEL